MWTKDPYSNLIGAPRIAISWHRLVAHLDSLSLAGACRSIIGCPKKVNKSHCLLRLNYLAREVCIVGV